jgi:hypothetical protein
MKIKRVQTLYSYKKADGSLHLRGVYSTDSPGGIPDIILQDAIKGRKTVRVLEWEEDKPEVKVVEPEKVKEKVVAKPDIAEPIKAEKKVVEKKVEEPPKRKKIVRKKKE